MLAIDMATIIVRGVLIGLARGLSIFDADFILINLNSLILVPSEEVYSGDQSGP